MAQLSLPEIIEVGVEELRLNHHNPRVKPTHSEREALEVLVLDQGEKLVRLATNIAETGLNPGELVWVSPLDAYGLRSVIEGNRRIAAIKLLNNPDVLDGMELPEALRRRFGRLTDQGLTGPDQVRCIELGPEDEHWLRLRHGGQQGGEGLIPWSTVAKRRFAEGSPALQALDHVKKGPYLSDAARVTDDDDFNLTTIERVLNTPEVREAVGIEIEDQRLTLSDPDAIARLSLIFNDVAEGNLPVSRVMTAEQRRDYAQQVSSRDLPSKGRARTGSSPNGAGSTKKKRKSASRTVSKLIPSSLNLSIDQPRAEAIFAELKRLNMSTYPNSVAVLFRVFLEMSIDQYVHNNQIDVKESNGRTLRLRERAKRCAKHLVDNGVCDKKELSGFNRIASSANQILSFDAWNDYVHNANFHPGPADLRSLWDNTEPLIKGVWR